MAPLADPLSVGVTRITEPAQIERNPELSRPGPLRKNQKKNPKTFQTTEIPARIKQTLQRFLKRSMNVNVGISVKDVSYSLETGSPI